MRRRSKPSESASRRPTVRTPDCCCDCCGKIIFLEIWVPSPENRDLRQLLWHRHRLVQMRTRIMNQLQALAMNEGQRRKKKLWSEAGRAQLEKLPLAPWASRRRQDLLELLDRMNPSIEELTAAIEREARKWPEVLRLMTHPGVGPLTALAFVLIIGTVERFQCGKQIGSYVGLIPCGGLQRGPSTTRPHHQARQFSAAFLAGGSSASGSALRCGLAATVHASGAAPAKEHRQGGHGPQTRQCGCTGCGGTAGNIQTGSNSVRTRDSSVPEMACSRTPST